MVSLILKLTAFSFSLSALSFLYCHNLWSITFTFIQFWQEASALKDLGEVWGSRTCSLVLFTFALSEVQSSSSFSLSACWLIWSTLSTVLVHEMSGSLTEALQLYLRYVRNKGSMIQKTFTTKHKNLVGNGSFRMLELSLVFFFERKSHASTLMILDPSIRVNWLYSHNGTYYTY